MNSLPENGFTTDVKIVRVVDADTYEVEISRRFHVRLQEQVVDNPNVIFDSPEKSTEYGKTAIKFIKSFLAGQEGARLFVPTASPINLMDVFSFDRVIGELWVKTNGVWGKLTSVLIDAGFGRMIRKEDRAKIPW